MKGAGSSWKFLKLFSIEAWNKNMLLVVFSFFILIHINSALIENSCSDETIKVFDNSIDDSKLVEELVDVSRAKSELPSDMNALLQPYDATPFWYNLVHSIAMASGINPETQQAMHQLATTSFSSSSLNSSIRKVLTYLKCGENKTAEDIIELSDIALNVADESKDKKDEGPVEWTPIGNSLAADWDREMEVDENYLQGIGARLRRALRDDGSRIMADFHQPFFMSEAGPSSLVTRDPALISVSGCPSGHIKDLTGSCRQIFQYTVNFGGGSNSLDGESAIPKSLFGGNVRRPPWFLGRPSTKTPAGTLRDIARDSSLFRHSVMRGYVPPFSFGRRRRPIQRTEAEKGRKTPEPMEIMSPMPHIIIMEAPTVPDIATPAPSRSEDSNNDNSQKGGSSSENTDSNSGNNNDNNQNSSNNDDDD